MTTALKVPFGVLDGVLVEPGSVQNGKACRCLCPGCSRPLVAYNQGKVRTTQYFGHQPGEDCGAGVESAIHMAGKEALVKSKEMMRPALLVGPRGIGLTGEFFEARVLVEAASRASYSSVEAEVTVSIQAPAPSPAAQQDLFGSTAPAPTMDPPQLVRPDLRATSGDLVDWVEIRVAHAVDSQKQGAMQRAGLRVIEVDLSRYLLAPASLPEIQRAVIEDAALKSWVAHPGVPQAMIAAAAEARRLEGLRILAASRYVEAKLPERRPIQWMGDGVPPEEPIVLPDRKVDTQAQHMRLEREQRIAAGLAPGARWPRHLDLDVPGNSGCSVPARLWLRQLFLDWVDGMHGGRFRVGDLVGAVKRAFGLEGPNGSLEVERVLVRRALPYWAACGFIELHEDGVIVITGTANGSRRS